MGQGKHIPTVANWDDRCPNTRLPAALRMLLQELPYQRDLVSREVVEDDMELLPEQAQRDDFLQESNDIPARVAGCGCSVNPAGCRFQRAIEGQRAGPVVLKDAYPQPLLNSNVRKLTYINGHLPHCLCEGREPKRSQKGESG